MIQNKKSTEHLQSELKKSENVEQFIQTNLADLKSKTVQEYLNEMLIAYNLRKKK